MNIRYIYLFVLAFVFFACDEDDKILPGAVILPELTAGSADFSNYVAVGASFTSGFTDGGLFIASQENSFPNILSKEFAKIGGGTFTQPLMNDNTGGILVGGNVARGYRLTFNSNIPGPQPLDAFLTGLGAPVPPITTEAGVNIGSDFNNFGIPGAKSWHLVLPGYASLNPYYARMASAPTATVLADAMSQNPTFFTLSEIGGNDVLGYATSGGDGSNSITPSAGDAGVGFDETFNALVATLTSEGAKGAVTNVPYITDLPHFTTVPYNPLDPTNPDFGPEIPTLNGIFGQLNQVYAFLNVPERSIVFSTTEASAVVIKDETLADLSVQIATVLNNSPAFPTFVQSFGLPAEAAPLVADLLGLTYGQTRQATEGDLFVLPSSAIIGTVNEDNVQALVAQTLPLALAGQFSVEGITLPLADKWVLLPSEQAEIKMATDAYNVTIAAVASSNDNIALVDLNSILSETASTGINFDGFNLNADLVTGGAIGLDGIHLTARGYALMANKFLEAIDNAFGSNFIESGNVAKANDYPTNYSPTLQ
ncbi:G-D-S-L family lipolytic protein [Flavivirga sp. 57AJ16]|uniref:G-D-S-L family lipolytic protein n=1 Tax=Flavivirga sp. 57AJ16 TaxID=3025307 RepID=UPI002365E8EA|nr:G-D-S-L family lipolytic protein [Flavivirga sp. 57AJ16]MDD7884698.1 G-D-S-L family lipolytic protein [Flavivirga sp. 57AJ16]